MKDLLRKQIEELKEKIITYYGNRLVSMVIFGSFARGTATLQSDIDILLIIKRLPKRKMKRIEEFIDNVENNLKNVSCYISPIIKTPEEASKGSPLFLDMVYESLILNDKNDFFQNIINKLKHRLEDLGSKRVFKGNRWYWILKPDIKPDEVFEI